MLPKTAKDTKDSQSRLDFFLMQEKMACTRAKMILHVEDNQLVHMISPDLMQIWLTLQHVHQAAGFATSLSLHQKFLMAKNSDSQTMQALIGQIQGLAFHMKHAKIAVTDHVRATVSWTVGLSQTSRRS